MDTINVAQPDVTLLLDLEGVIREARLSVALGGAGLNEWVGRHWSETVGELGSEKVLRMLDDARNSGVSAFRQIKQRFPGGTEVPMEYTTVLLGGRAGILAIGKSLQAVAELQSRFIAAQQAMERDYWKLREVETRYRQLFHTSSEAILIVRAPNLKVMEGNLAAVQALGLNLPRPQDIAGREVLGDIAPAEREPFQAMLARVREQGTAPGVVVRLGPERRPWMIRASLMSADPAAIFMLNLSSLGTPQVPAVTLDTVSFEDLIERIPDAFVVLSRDGMIRRANRAFLEMVGVGARTSVIGESLSRWLWQPGADLTVLLTNIERHGVIRLLSTIVHSELGIDTEVEISAVGNADSEFQYIGVILRDVSRRIAADGDGQDLRASLGAIAEKIGKVSLQSLVKQTVGAVERHYVREALTLANGNRTVAAELLGLSRQGLYAKLNRYGIESGSEQDKDV